jgi:DNA-binding MarR family transcriptional regulator
MRAEIAERVRRAGFDDITLAQLVIFRHEGPDGRRPTEIAHGAGLSKQATNDMLGQLERSGYLVREAHPDDRRSRIVRLTDRGRALAEVIQHMGGEVERGWRERIGDPSWRAFRDVLDEIATHSTT